jgi:DNA-binding beta-propeller fold protein YncE
MSSNVKGSGIEPLIVALGDRHYQVNRPWAADPRTQNRIAGWRSDVATDSADRLYVFNRFDRYIDPAGLPVVTVYERTGQLARTLELPDVSDGHGISIGPADEIVLVDRDRHVVLILANDGTAKLILGERDKPGRPFSHPTAARIGPGGDIFVTDGYGNSHVHRFSSAGKLIRSWGVPGTGPGEFSTPHDLAFTKDGTLVVCDRENNRIQFFDVDGNFIRDTRDVFHPMAVVVDTEDMVLVSDQIPRLSMFDPQGRLAGRCRPALYGGHGMCLDSAGNIYLAELRVNRITRLERLR